MNVDDLRLPSSDDPRIRQLEAADEVDLGAELLAGAPTNENRTTTQLEQWSRNAAEYGAQLVDDATSVAVAAVVERSGGLDGTPVLARYSSKVYRIELFEDTLQLCERVIDHFGWRSWFPAGSVRAAAVAHEHAHALIGRDHGKKLRLAVGHRVLSVGRLTRFGFVVGTDELAAHAYAARSLRLSRSPLLFTAAAMATLELRHDTATTR